VTTTETATIASDLRQLLGPERVLDAHSDLMVYECDAFVLAKNGPDVVVFPETTQEVAKIVQLCNEQGVSFVPRGAGTSLAGGSVPVGGGVMIVLTRMREILEVNLRDRYAVVEPGVVNAWLNKRLAGTGYHYAPDPSSQGACSIGGNVATNAGGPHTLKYGVTVNHVLGLEIVTPQGEIVRIGGPVEDPPGLDLAGTIVGSEGTLGIATKIWVRLTRNPEGVRTMLGVFDSVVDATQTISGIIGAGIIPAALEMMDQGIIVAVEAAFHFGFPLDAEAVLLIEVDGLEVGRRPARPGGGDLPRKRCPRSAIRRQRKRAAGALEKSQTGLRRDRATEPQLLHSRRRRAAYQTAARLAAYPCDRRQV
jgi:glycolate oxidase